METPATPPQSEPGQEYGHLPTENFEQRDLCSCLLDGLSGAFLSRVARQLLGCLASASADNIPLVVAKELQSNSGRMTYNYVLDVDASGATMSESLLMTASDLWLLIWVREISHHNMVKVVLSR
jgi:hypothetical protein